MGRFLNRYANNLTRIIPYIHQIGDLLERESLLTDEFERNYLQEKIAILTKALDELVKTTTPVVPLLKGLETGNAPGQGKIKEVTPDQPPSRPCNPMQDIFAQMSQPENLQSIMGMVGQMINPEQSGQGRGSGGSGLDGLMSSVLGNLPGGMGGLMGAMMGGGNRTNLRRSSNGAMDELNNQESRNSCKITFIINLIY